MTTKVESLCACGVLFLPMSFIANRLHTWLMGPYDGVQAKRASETIAKHQKIQHQNISLEDLPDNILGKIIRHLYTDGHITAIAKLKITSKKISRNVNLELKNNELSQFKQLQQNIKKWLIAKNITKQERLERQAAKDLIIRAQHSGGDLNLSPYRSLTELPQGLQVKGNLALNYCENLKKLPDGLTVGGNLGLYHCTSLKHLPVGLNVGGDLYMYYCTSLIELPEGLNVGGELNLTFCIGLTRLPKKINIGGVIHMYLCHEQIILSAQQLHGVHGRIMTR